MQVGDRVHMKDTGRTGTIAAVEEGGSGPVYTVAFDPALDEVLGAIAPPEPGPATIMPGLPADAFEPTA